MELRGTVFQSGKRGKWQPQNYNTTGFGRRTPPTVDPRVRRAGAGANRIEIARAGACCLGMLIDFNQD